MNEKAEQLINEAGEKVLAYLDATESFTIEQAPLLAQEIVLFGLWQHGIFAVFCLGMVAGSFLLVGLSITKRPREFIVKHTEGAAYIVFLFFLIPVVIGSVEGIKSVIEFLKAAVAPRLYIIEQIAGLLT